MSRLNQGSRVPSLQLVNLQGQVVRIPDDTMPLVHLQFRRFAGCPICNLHVREMANRLDEIRQAGIREVTFFHSNAQAMLPYQGDLPFDCIADPDKVFYRRFGVETSVVGMLHPRNLIAAMKGMTASFPSHLSAGGEAGHMGMPADFLIDSDGFIVACHYGSYADDQWTVDELLALAKRALLDKQLP